MTARPLPRSRALAGRATVLLTASAALLVGCSSASPSSAGGAPDPAASVEPSAAVLRVGPLSTQNTLTLAASDGPLADAVAGAGGQVEVTSSFPAFAPAAEALVAGRIDMTTGSSTALVAALEGAPDLVVFAVEENDDDTQGIVAAPGTGIGSVADLAGRTVAINEGGTGDYLLRQALTQAGMSIDDVVPVHLSPPDAATAFAGGQVDAWATWDQYLVAAESLDGAALVATAADIGASNRTVHVVSREVLTEHPDLVVAAYEALDDQAAAVLADPALLRSAYLAAGAEAHVAERVAAKTPPTVRPAGEEFRAELRDLARFYAEQGLTPDLVDVGDAVVDVTGLP